MRSVSTPGRSRTCDISFRKAALYPSELREQNLGGRQSVATITRCEKMAANCRIPPASQDFSAGRGGKPGEIARFARNRVLVTLQNPKLRIQNVDQCAGRRFGFINGPEGCMTDQSKERARTDASHRAETSPTLSLIWHGVLMAVGGIPLWALFELQRAPYRPPFDMNPLLGAGEIEAVQTLMGVIVVMETMLAVSLCFRLSRLRKQR